MTLSGPLPCGGVSASCTGLTASYKTLGVGSPLIFAPFGVCLVARGGVGGVACAPNMWGTPRRDACVVVVPPVPADGGPVHLWGGGARYKMGVIFGLQRCLREL